MTLTDDARRGLLGQGSILDGDLLRDSHLAGAARQMDSDEYSGHAAARRRRRMFPPLKENTEGGKLLSVRERLEEHRKNPACASCHKIMDPLGFALENFDAVGPGANGARRARRSMPRAMLVDGSKVDGPVSLRSACWPARERFATLTEKLLTYALGRGVEYYDMPAVRQSCVHPRRTITVFRR